MFKPYVISLVFALAGATKRKKVRTVDFCDTLAAILRRAKKEQIGNRLRCRAGLSFFFRKSSNARNCSWVRVGTAGPSPSSWENSSYSNRIKQHPIGNRKLKSVTPDHLQAYIDLLSFGGINPDGTAAKALSKGYLRHLYQTQFLDVPGNCGLGSGKSLTPQFFHTGILIMRDNALAQQFNSEVHKLLK